MELPDKIKKHPLYLIAVVIVTSCGSTWYLANELLVKPKDLTIEHKNACIDNYKNQLDIKMVKNTPEYPAKNVNKAQTSMQDKPIMYMEDLILSIAGCRSGFKTEIVNRSEREAWQMDVLGMLHDIFVERQNDVYIAWLRPPDKLKNKLAVYAEHGLPVGYKHHQFHLNEGLAGKVWATGTPAATSVMKQHPWWVYREGCTNVSYICAPVGEKAGCGGILAVGSDKGFTVYDSDQHIVQAFAALLAVSESPETK